MERSASDGEFRANLHLGGTAVPYTPDKATEALALAATRAHGLGVAGVDIIHSSRGPLLLEVNSSPGLEGIEQVTQIDIATEIIRFLEQSAVRKKRPSSRKHKRGR
jgi:ribosomal protein S6--L-glutamate ligase